MKKNLDRNSIIFQRFDSIEPSISIRY